MRPGRRRAWDETVGFAALDSLVSDLEDGRGAELAFDAEVDMVTVPIGPPEVSRTVDEWRLILKRELEDVAGLDELSTLESTGWEGPRHPFHLLDSE